MMFGFVFVREARAMTFGFDSIRFGERAQAQRVSDFPSELFSSVCEDRIPLTVRSVCFCPYQTIIK